MCEWKKMLASTALYSGSRSLVVRFYCSFGFTDSNYRSLHHLSWWWRLPSPSGFSSSITPEGRMIFHSACVSCWWLWQGFQQRGAGRLVGVDDRTLQHTIPYRIEGEGCHCGFSVSKKAEEQRGCSFKAGIPEGHQ